VSGSFVYFGQFSVVDICRSYKSWQSMCVCVCVCVDEAFYTEDDVIGTETSSTPESVCTLSNIPELPGVESLQTFLIMEPAFSRD
jgi:hypothetical protein